MTKDIQRRLETLQRFLEDERSVSEESLEDQVELLLFYGNVLGLSAAVAHVRKQLALDSVADRYRRAHEAEERAHKALEEHYMPRIHALLEQGDIAGAEALKKEIPSDSVCFVFAIDAIQQATRKS
jgi:sensor c-di-GMP phosphodiesterase-like protein